MEITESQSKDYVTIEKARRATLDEMRTARRGLTVHDSELLKHYCSELLQTRMEAERLKEQLHACEMRNAELWQENHRLETLNRALRATLRAQAKYIARLEQRRPAARGKQLWIAVDFGRNNLTKDFTAERAEPRLGAQIWAPPGLRE